MIVGSDFDKKITSLFRFKNYIDLFHTLNRVAIRKCKRKYFVKKGNGIF